MQIDTMNIVVVTDKNCCLYMVNDRVIVNAPDEGSDNQDNMFWAFANLFDINPSEYTMTANAVLEKWPNLTIDDIYVD